MTSCATRLTAAAMAAGLVGACTTNSSPTATAPPSSTPRGSSLDGIYTIETGPYQEYVNLKTRPVDSYTVAFRSACTDTGCVATESSVGSDDRPAAGQPARIFDFVDGNWRWAGDVEGTCGQSGSDATLAAQYFKSMSLSPQPDGTLTGTLVTLGGADPCHVANHAPVRVTRVGNVDPDVSLPDPSTLVAPVASPAGGLQGAYDYHYTDRKFGTELPVTRSRLSTYCLRTGTRCSTLLLLLDGDGKPGKFQVLGYADQHWTQTTGGGDAPCTPPLPGTATKSVVTDLPLPDPPTDPISRLAGVETTKWAGPCPAERANDVVLTRTGD
jgi:serine/threonine-protein kinase